MRSRYCPPVIAFSWHRTESQEKGLKREERTCLSESIDTRKTKNGNLLKVTRDLWLLLPKGLRYRGKAKVFLS